MLHIYKKIFTCFCKKKPFVWIKKIQVLANIRSVALYANCHSMQSEFLESKRLKNESKLSSFPAPDAPSEITIKTVKTYVDATHNMSAGDIMLSWKPPSNVSARNKIDFYRIKFRKEGPLHHLQYLVPHVNYTDVPGVRKCWKCTFIRLRFGLCKSCLKTTDTKNVLIFFL